ncbi:hypothetical protein [Metapseudomonas otitidis]|uniref:hypothetical protein n=1 Tax=Metapseudomonas otitidis TaxID=319939 RepID=UPI001CA399DB|nr:hypothetical protein [Pseudomonas otitidis]QZX85601.1 hypothetical protein K6751_13185 [Pseudomonas otitidis]
MIFMMNRKSSGFLLGRFTVVAMCLLVVACGEKEPSVNTPKYRAAHGVVEGDVNVIEVSGVLFRLPKDTDFDVYSSGVIQPGRADRLTIRLYMDHRGLHDRKKISTEGLTWIDISRMGDPNGKTNFQVEQERLGLPTVRPSLGLIEYPLQEPVSQAEYSGSYIYIPYGEAKGSVRELYCTVAWPKDPDKVNGDCRASYYLDSGLLVQVLFPYRALVNWKSIMRAVVQELGRIEIKANAQGGAL